MEISRYGDRIRARILFDRRPETLDCIVDRIPKTPTLTLLDIVSEMLEVAVVKRMRITDDGDDNDGGKVVVVVVVVSERISLLVARADADN